METNGHTTKPSFLREALGMLEDHAELASLEWRYERSQAIRRLVAVAIATGLAFGAFLLLLIATVYGLVSLGLNVGWVALGLGVLCAIASAIIVQTVGQRDPRAGRPFEGTRRQAHESIEWIQKLFS
jgi:uncharacterized membrane protein YqjE